MKKTYVGTFSTFVTKFVIVGKNQPSQESKLESSLRSKGRVNVDE